MKPGAAPSHAAWQPLHPLGSGVSLRAANAEAVWRLLRAIVVALLLTRASLDPVFNLMGGEGGAMGLGALVNLLAIAAAAGLLLQTPLRAPFPVLAIWGPFLLIAFASTIYAPDFQAAARLAFVLVTYWAFFAAPFFLLRSSLDVSRFVLVVLGSSVPPTLYAFVDIAHGVSDLGDFRLQSTFSHPNIYAFYVVLLIGLVLYARASRIVRITPWMRTLLTLYVPLLVLFLLLTKTRSAWGACGLMVLVYAVRIDRRFLAGILLVPLLFVANPSLLERLTDVTAATEVDSFSQLNDSNRLNSYVWRKALWESALPQVLQQPLLGHGLESFKPATPRFFPLIGPEGIDGHNVYLQIGFELGLMGLLALVWIIASVAWRLLRGLRHDPPGLLVMLCILGAYVLESYSDNMHFYLSFNWYFWFVMGTLCAWLRLEEGPGGAVGPARRRNGRRPADVATRPSRAGTPEPAHPVVSRHAEHDEPPPGRR